MFTYLVYVPICLFSHAFFCYYFIIPTSNKNNLIRLFITQTPEGKKIAQFL